MPVYPDPETLEEPEALNIYDAIHDPAAKPNSVRLIWSSSQILQVFDLEKILFKVYDGEDQNFVPGAFFNNGYVDLVINKRIRILGNRLELWPEIPVQEGMQVVIVDGEEQPQFYPVIISKAEIDAKLAVIRTQMLNNFEQVCNWIAP